MKVMNKELDNLIKKRMELENFLEITFYVPCYNEEGSIIVTLKKIISVAKELNITFDLLVYNDGSTDNTRQLVENFAKDHPEILIRIVNNKKRKGLGFNYIDGAFLGFGKYYIMICGDNSETRESMMKILEKRGSADIVIPYFGNLDTRNTIRKILSRLFILIVNLINGHKIKYYNGVVLHLRQNVMRWHPTSSGFAYQAELLSILLNMNKSYIETKISNIDRKEGFSKAFTVQNCFSVMHSLLQIFFRRIRSTIWKL